MMTRMTAKECEKMMNIIIMTDLIMMMTDEIMTVLRKGIIKKQIWVFNLPFYFFKTLEIEGFILSVFECVIIQIWLKDYI